MMTLVSFHALITETLRRHVRAKYLLSFHTLSCTRIYPQHSRITFSKTSPTQNYHQSMELPPIMHHCITGKFKVTKQQESSAVARKDTLQPIQFLLQYWPSRSFKVNDFHVIWKPIGYFLLVINSKIGHIIYHFRDMLKNAHFPTPSIQPPISKCSPCTRLLKFCMPKFNTHC